MICQKVCPAPARKSTKPRASRPKSPTPNGPGQGRRMEKHAARPREPHGVPEGAATGAVMDPAAQHLGDAPRLRDAAAGPVRVEGSKISLIVPMHASSRCGMKPSRKRRAPDAVVRMHLEPCVDERADQPCPHRALVIGRVARAQVAEVRGLKSGWSGDSERSPPGSGDVSRATLDAPRPSATRRARDARARWRRAGSAAARSSSPSARALSTTSWR